MATSKKEDESNRKLIKYFLLIMIPIWGYTYFFEYSPLDEKGIYVIGEVTGRTSFKGSKALNMKFTASDGEAYKVYKAVIYGGHEKRWKVGDEIIVFYLPTAPSNNFPLTRYPIPRDSPLSDSAKIVNYYIKRDYSDEPELIPEMIKKVTDRSFRDSTLITQQ